MKQANGCFRMKHRETIGTDRPVAGRRRPGAVRGMRLAFGGILLAAALAGLAAALAQRRSRFDRMPFGTLLAAGAFVWTAVRSSGAVPAVP